MQATIPKVGATDIDYFDKVTGKKALEVPKVNQGQNFERNMIDKSGMPVVGCMPGCAHDHRHVYEQDFSKNIWDPINESPGYFKDFNEELAQNQQVNPRGTNVKFTCNQQCYDLCSFGKKGTPINLNSSIKCLDDYKDDCFSVKYADVNAAKQRKYKESGQQYQIVMEGKPEDNVMETSTIGLFDRHIKKASLYGLQAHFHAPSEHSVDGKLLDLEMHIVHALQPEYVSGNPSQKSQFTNGVLGFLFRAVKDDYFTNNGVDDFHDRFLATMLTDQVGQKLDMTKFVQSLNYDRRWTYPGSLTTTPFSEGILWNVIEQVIPIRQSTLDKFLEYKKIEQSTMFAQFPSEQARTEAAEMRSHEPENIKPFRD